MWLSWLSIQININELNTPFFHLTVLYKCPLGGSLNKLSNCKYRFVHFKWSALCSPVFSSSNFLPLISHSLWCRFNVERTSIKTVSFFWAVHSATNNTFALKFKSHKILNSLYFDCLFILNIVCVLYSHSVLTSQSFCWDQQKSKVFFDLVSQYTWPSGTFPSA